MNQQDIEQVVKAVLLKMQSSDTPPAAVHEMGVFASLDDAVAAAKVAQQGLKSVAMRQLAIAAIREAGEKHACRFNLSMQHPFQLSLSVF